MQQRAFWSGSLACLARTPAGQITGALAEAQIRHHRTNDIQQLRAWEETIALLRRIGGAEAESWHVLLEYPMLRLGKRADAILLTPRAILVLEFKIGACAFMPADRAQAEDYALDLADFHAGSRCHPIIPVLVATNAPARPACLPLLLTGVSSVVEANTATLAGTLRALVAAAPAPAEALDAAAWMAAPYRPVPTIVEAACMLFGRHGVAEIAAARADADNLGRTTAAILAEVAAARAAERRLVLFVTGIPGAGKTLCGLNAAFGGVARATFLTGNPTLVHVLREALARDAIGQGAQPRAARQRMEGAIQALPRFRDHYVASDEVPAERIVVIDEAQRCWARAHAVAKTRDRPVQLSDSEPGHLLSAMGRHEGFAAIICLVGHGQEIHDGEGGLAEWGAALRAHAGWRVRAAADLFATADPRQKLGVLEDLRAIDALHLQVPIRQIRSSTAAAWVDHVLAGCRCRQGDCGRRRSFSGDAQPAGDAGVAAGGGARHAAQRAFGQLRRAAAARGGIGRGVAAYGRQGGGALVSRSVAGRARIGRAGGGGHGIQLPGAGTGLCGPVLGCGFDSGAWPGGLAGAGFSRHGVDGAFGGGEDRQSREHVSGAADAGAV
jgi:hypothetical protein